MSFDFGEDEKWNLLLLKAEIAASTARIGNRKSDKEKALAYFEKLVSTSKAHDGKARALVGVVLSCISLEMYKKALTTAGWAVHITRLEVGSKNECCKYVKDLAIESYRLAARRFTTSLNSHRRKKST